MLPVRQGNVGGIAQRVTPVLYAAVHAVLCRQPSAAVIRKAHSVRLHVVQPFPFFRGGERHFRYLVKTVVAEGPCTVLPVTAQQAAQLITLLPLITHPAFCALRLDDDRKPARIQRKHPYQAVRALFSRQPSVAVVAEPVLSPVAVAQTGNPSLRGIMPARLPFLFIHVARQQPARRVLPGLHAARDAAVAAQ
ncbi:hypothetical protein BvCmsB54A_04155 [Escherichia coli]|nr:hypothetical protein BvCmsB54A_04155 [Escherichia coli]